MNYFLNSKLRVLNFTHVDMDGAASSIVIRNYYKNVITKTITYGRESDIIPKMVELKDKYDVVIFTDFCPENLTQVKAFGAPVLVLDHHESMEKFNDVKNNIYICTKFCGAKLAYEFYNNNDCLKHLEKLIDIVNDYDLYILKDPSSKCFNSLFWKMGFEWFCERFLTGDITLSKSEKLYLVRKQKEFNEIYANLPIQELSNKGVVCTSDVYISEITDALRNDGYEWCIVYHRGLLSVRSNTGFVDLVKVTERLGKGGGHKYAVGIIQNKDNLNTLIKKIEKCVDDEIKSQITPANEFMDKLKGK